MKKFIPHFFSALLVAIIAASNIWGATMAASNSPAQTAESIRSSLVQAQLDLADDPGTTAVLITDAKTAYQSELSELIAAANPDAQRRILSAFEVLTESVSQADAVTFAAARAQIWTGILAGSNSIVEQAIQSGDGATARTWLSVREFPRHYAFLASQCGRDTGSGRFS